MNKGEWKSRGEPAVLTTPCNLIVAVKLRPVTAVRTAFASGFRETRVAAAYSSQAFVPYFDSARLSL